MLGATADLVGSACFETGNGCVPANSPSTRRCRLSCERRCFAASLRSTDPRVGRVRLRCLGGAVASVSSALSRAAAASRLRNCDRYSLAVTVTTPSARRPARAPSARSFSGCGSASDVAMSNESSAWLSVVLTDCPPGPDDRENRQDSSSAGIVMPRTVTSRLTAACLSQQGRGCCQAGPAPPSHRAPLW
jgi:hypothetical protein